MIKFKRLLFEEEINENILRAFKNNCATFLEINSGQLKNGNILKRGTLRSYDRNIIKKNFRKRKDVFGDGFKTWMYEYFKPSGHPSREEMIPTQNGKLDGHFRKRGVYGVFPIGRNYKIQYSKRVEDFNSGNPYFPHYGLLSVLWKVKDRPEEYDLDEYQLKRLDELAEFHHREISGRYDDIRKVYTRLWNELKDFEHVDPKIEDKFRNIRESIEAYFRNSEVSKEVPDQLGLEVNLYAPGGFYYVAENVLTKVIQKSIKN